MSTLAPPGLRGDASPAERSTLGEVRQLHAAGALDLPLPGSGRTAQRWHALAAIAADDLAVVRLAEGHVDAVAILAELGHVAAGRARDGLLGVWAAEPPTHRVEAVRAGGTWRLHGRKAWCSGALGLDAALVTAHADDDRRLFLVADWQVVPGSWPAVGMAGSGTLAVDFDGVAAEPVGEPGAYLDRPGFWQGGIGVAACWYGGALGAARVLLSAARQRTLDSHALAHLGAVDAVVTALGADLDDAAAAFDEDPLDRRGEARVRALRVRARVEAGATEVLDRVGRALGPTPACTDAAHARRVADLPVYLRQSHAERDLAALGEAAVESAIW